MLGGGSGNIPQTLDQLLERQWEQGSQFLMEQAQHFDSECIFNFFFLNAGFFYFFSCIIAVVLASTASREFTVRRTCEFVASTKRSFISCQC